MARPGGPTAQTAQSARSVSDTETGAGFPV
jgi:hypothetical protein